MRKISYTANQKHNHSWDCENRNGEIACGFDEARIDRIVAKSAVRLARRRLFWAQNAQGFTLYRDAFLLHDALRGVQFRSGSEAYYGEE